MDFIQKLKDQLCDDKKFIVFPEGEDPRILWAAVEHKKDGLLEPVVLGYQQEIEATAKENNLDITDLRIVDLGTFEARESLIEAFVERRKGKIDKTRARAMLKDPNYLGTLMVYKGHVDGLVSGAVHTTGQTILPALQIIKTKPEFKRVSGLFFMVRGDEMYLMADCAINTEMDAQTLAEIAVATDMTGRQFGMEPKIAMLSFSTKGSAKSDDVKKVEEATEIVNSNFPDIICDGEMQFDAAFDPVVAEKKAPMSQVAGHANSFIFPNLEAGNIGYKIAQRFGGFTAVGPVLQGLNRPVNDLSRGCTKEEAYQLALITAVQACMS